MAIKVAHIAAFTPHRAGLYETTREVILAERKQGIDARLVDCGNPNEANLIAKEKKKLLPFYSYLGKAALLAVNGAIEYLKSQGHFVVEPVKPGTEDRGIVVEDEKWAIEEADILVGHSGFSEALQKLKKPLVLCCHGRPRSSFLLEWQGKYPVYSGYSKLNADPRVLKFVTFWKEHIPNLAMVIDKEKLAYVPPCVDLDFFSPRGKKGEFPDPNRFNIVIVDIWREDIDPWDVFHCCYLFCEKHPEAQFHMFGCKPPSEIGPWAFLLKRAQSEGKLGIVSGLIDAIDEVYRTADMMVTPHTIATRTVRESLASGLPLVAAEGNKYTNFHAPLYDYDRFVREMERCYQAIQLDRESISRKMRESAKKHFDMNNTGIGMKQVLEEALDKWSSLDLDVKKEAVVL